MADWLSPMQQTFEYYTVDPVTWKDVKLLDTVKSCSVSRDLETETLGSASIDVSELFGEMYIRIYLITVQNGVREKHPLATMLVQTPSSKFDGKSTSVSMDAYTPLIELKENQPPLGYFVPERDNVMDTATRLTEEHLRAPVVGAKSDSTLFRDFVANSDDTWMTFISDLMGNAKFYFGLDEMGRILFEPKQDTASLQPIWTYDDSNSSILYPEIEVDHDLYGIPNVVEVVYSDSHDQYYARVVNDDENSPISTINRGREIVHRVENPDLTGIPTQAMITEFAEQLLRELSTLEYRVSYTHGYCPVRIGDCVRLNYERAGLTDIKARVISQSIKCEPGCPVNEKAAFTMKLWR
jgi:hypothetical protein